MKQLKPWLVALLLIVAVGVVSRPFLSSGKEMGQAVMLRQRALQALGETLAPEFGSQSILVVSNPYSEKSGQLKDIRRFERAGIEGLELGFGENTQIKRVFPVIKPEYRDHPEKAVIPPRTKTPLSFLMDAKSIDELALAHPSCELIVSLIGLPVGIEQLSVWKDDQHRFALLLPDLRVLGSKGKALSAFQSGKIAAIVVDDPRTGEPLIIDASNVKQIVSERPQLLGFKRQK